MTEKPPHGMPPAEQQQQQQQQQQQHGADANGQTDAEKPHQARKRCREVSYMQERSRRQITFSKRKSGLLKKAQDLHRLTNTSVFVVIVSEAHTVFTWASEKFVPLESSPYIRAKLDECLLAPDVPGSAQLLPPPPSDGDGSDDNSESTAAAGGTQPQQPLPQPPPATATASGQMVPMAEMFPFLGPPSITVTAAPSLAAPQPQQQPLPLSQVMPPMVSPRISVGPQMLPAPPQFPLLSSSMESSLSRTIAMLGSGAHGGNTNIPPLSLPTPQPKQEPQEGGTHKRAPKKRRS